MELVNYRYLEGLFKEAETEAKKSPCVRRQYGATIFSEYQFTKIVEYNARVTNACGKGGCIREQQGILNGNHTMVELGAEIHAEQAALIRSEGKGDIFLLVGFVGDHELLGKNVFPCIVCARMIKYAGYTHIYMRNEQREISPYSIAEIIEYGEDVLLND